MVVPGDGGKEGPGLPTEPGTPETRETPQTPQRKRRRPARRRRSGRGQGARNPQAASAGARDPERGARKDKGQRAPDPNAASVQARGAHRGAHGGRGLDARDPRTASALPRRAAPMPWRLFQAALLAVVATLFLLSIEGFLNPFLLYCALVVLLAPFRSVRGHAHVMVVATVLILLWLLKTTGALLAPFFLAFVLAYMLDPLVDRLSARPRIGRQTAIALILAPVLAAGGLAVAVIVPAMLRQAGQLMLEAPDALAAAHSWAVGLATRAAQADLPFVDAPRLLANVQAVDQQAVADFLAGQASELASGAWAAFLGLGRGFGTLITVASYLVLTPVLAVYLLRDYDAVVAAVARLVPVRYQDETRRCLREYDALLSRYLRGQILVAAIVGGLTWLGLLLAGFPYAFFLGATVAVLGIVPYLGLLLALVPAVIIALASGDPGLGLLKVAIVYGAAQTLEGTVISPRIVGGSVGLHPVWILLALALGGLYFGFAGLLLGVPAAVGVKLLAARAVASYRASGFYRART